MKYIRTEDDKIFLIQEDLFTKGVWWFETKGEVLQISCIPSDLGKVADTIEELCDEFVRVFDKRENREPTVLPNKDTRWYSGHKSIVYGAIWTDKGLIYVAKMDDKGELELL